MNYNVNSWQGAVREALLNVAEGTLSFLPNVLAAIIIFIVGILIGNWSKTLIIKGLGLLKIDSLIKDSKLKQGLKKAEISQKIEIILGSLVKWLLVIAFSIAALNVLGLSTISNLLTNLLSYLPNVISAVIVLAIGIFLAGVIEDVVKGALASIDLKTSRLMGKVASYTIVIVAILVAFSELNIAQRFINIIFIGFVSMLSLGLGLSIGLGSKDLVSKLLGEWHKNLKKELKK